MSNDWDRRGNVDSGGRGGSTVSRSSKPGGGTLAGNRYAGVAPPLSDSTAAAPVQGKNLFASLPALEANQPVRDDDPLDFTSLYGAQLGATAVSTPIQRRQSLEPATDPVHDRGPMVNLVTSAVQRRATTSAMDAPRADSLREDRATIGAVPAVAAREQRAEVDASKADSLSEDRATIAPEAESAPGPLAPKRAARAAAKNPALVARHGISGAELGIDAAPDSAAFAQAVAGFQEQHGLAVDGIVGPKTAAAMRGGGGAPAGETGSGDSAPAADPGASADIDARGAGSSLLQLKVAASVGSEEDVHRAANDGIASGGQSLPHLERIQAAFGAHDVTGIQAHVGGPAASASEAIGAEAYATGNHVAFKQSPDLHTAAHEAAHVVQQRGGVQLKGGVGQAGDSYEQHADAVADKVVRGDSAEALLGPVGALSAGAGVQRKPRSAGGGQTAGPIPTFAAPVLDLGERMANSGPGAFLPFWIIRQPGETIPAPLSLTVQPKLSGASMEPLAHAFAFRLGTKPAWMRQGETAVMASVQFEPEREGVHEAELVLRSGGQHESRMTLRGTGVADGHMADNDATGGESIVPGGARGGPERDGGPRDGQRGPAPGPEAPLSDADAKSYARRLSTVLRDLYGVRITQIALLKDEAMSEVVPPLQSEEEVGFLRQAAWMALDLVTARLSGLVQAAVEGAPATHRIIGTLINTGLAKGAEFAKSEFTLVSDQQGTAVNFQAVAQKGSAESSDPVLAFFYSQMFALERVRSSLTAKGEKDFYNRLKAKLIATEALEVALGGLAAGLDAIRALQADTTLARWISFLSQRAAGSRDGKTDIAAPGLASFDSKLHVPLQPGAMLDIGVRGGRVDSARIAGTSEKILSRLYNLDLIANRVPMRVFQAGLNGYAVLRDESGSLRIQGNVGVFARLRGPVEGLSDEQRQTEGARYLVEDLVGGRTLAEHGVVLEDVD